MEDKRKIILINVISMIMLAVCLGLCVVLVLMSNPNIKISERSVDELPKNYISTEEKSTIYTWDISATENDNVKATLSDDGSLTISGTGNMKDWSYDSTTEWHGMKDQVKTVVIENGVISIGTYAFYGCESLTNIEISQVVTSIGHSAFSFCRSLKNIEIPNNVTCIESNVFKSCENLETIEIPEGVTSIGIYAFSFCRSLTSINIPSSMINIGIGAFYHCESLTSLEIPEAVTSVERSAFSYCESLTRIEVAENNKFYMDDNGVLYTKNGDKIIMYPLGKKEQKYTILNGTIHIESSAFYNCTRLISIEIPESVTNIGDSAFYNCTSLTSLEIPESVTSIGDSSFSNCRVTKLIDVNNNELPNILKRTQDENNILYSSSNLKCTNCTIEDNIIKIQDKQSYAKLEVVEGKLKNLIYIISSNSWDISKKLDETVIARLSENGTLTISGSGDMRNWDYADNTTDWHGIKRIVNAVIIENTVTQIGAYAFYGLSLSNIEIPSSVKNIGVEAFNCDLINIKVDENNANFMDDNGVLYTEDGSEIIRYPKGKKSVEYTILNSTTKIGRDAFSGCTSLKSVKMPESVTNIGSYAFRYCTNLISIEMSNNLTQIETFAFDECISLVNIEIPSSVTEIGIQAFSDCTNLTNIKVNKNNTNYMDDKGVLYTKDGIQIIKYPEGKDETQYSILKGVEIIRNFAFYSCESLTSVEIPESVTNIADSAFELCNNLTIICSKGSTAETYVKENEKNYIIMSKIQPQTTIKETRANIESNIEYKIVNKNNEEILVTAYTGTGYKIKVNGNDVHTIIVAGDCTGDGKSDIQDIFAINKQRLNNVKLTNEYLLAGDVNEDGKTNINDIFEINKYRLGIKTEL